MQSSLGQRTTDVKPLRLCLGLTRPCLLVILGVTEEHVAGEERMRRTFSRQCPHCTRQATWPDTPTYPFCSERCQLIDLGAWASGEYRIPCEPLAEEEHWLETDVPDGEGEVEF